MLERIEPERDLTLPPHSLQAEAGVLGSIIKSPKAIARVSQLQPDDFYMAKNRQVFAAMRSLFADGVPIDLNTVSDRLQQRGEYESSGGLLYLSEMDLSTPTAAHVEHYANIVLRCSVNRRLISASATIAEMAYRDTLEPGEAISEALAQLQSVVRAGGASRVVSPQDRAQQTAEALEQYATGKLAGISTGFLDLDAMTGGLERGTVTLLGARLKTGKTSLAWQMAEAAEKVGPVLYASQEMNAPRLGIRSLAHRLGISRTAMRRGRLDQIAWERIRRELDRVDSVSRIHVLHGSATTTDIRAAAMEVQAKYGPLALIVEDYLQLLGDKAEAGSKRRDLDVGAAAERLVALAQEMNCPVLCLAQLSRDAGNEIPTARHFADSDGPARHVDTLLGMHRPDSVVGPSGMVVRPGELDVYLLAARDIADGPTKATLIWTGEGYESMELDHGRAVA